MIGFFNFGFYAKVFINKNKVPLGEILTSIINTKDPNNNNLFWYCLKKQVKAEKTDWYDSTIPDVGLFNNLKSIAGVPGGDPFPLMSNSDKKTKPLLKVSNGNLKVSKK